MTGALGSEGHWGDGVIVRRGWAGVNGAVVAPPSEPPVTPDKRGRIVPRNEKRGASRLRPAWVAKTRSRAVRAGMIDLDPGLTGQWY